MSASLGGCTAVIGPARSEFFGSIFGTASGCDSITAARSSLSARATGLPGAPLGISVPPEQPSVPGDSLTCCPPYGVLQQRPHARWLPHGGHAMGHTAQAGRAAFGAGPVPDFGEAQRPWSRILRWKGAAFGPWAWCACPRSQRPLNRHPAARGNRALGSAGQVDGATISPTGLSVREPIVSSQIRPQTTRSPTDATHTPTPIH